MPVLATLTVLAMLRDEEGAGLPFTDADVLEQRLRDGLEGEPGDVLEQSLALADQMRELLTSYRAGVDGALDGYIEKSEDRYSEAQELISRLGPADLRRRALFEQLIGLRRALRDMLTEQQWLAVFG
mgnify:CR=1 FL=1